MNEVFYSIQGEGLWIGAPMVFVRLHGCNLSCPWCDTKYSWDDDNCQRMDNHEIWREVNMYADYGSLCKNVCFTGGEPLLQQKDLGILVDALHQRRYVTHIETNGTIAPEGPVRKIHHWVISPKRFDETGLIMLDEVIQKAGSVPTLKFVVTEGESLQTLRDLAEKYNQCPIVLQPERYAFSRARDGEHWMTPVGVYLKRMAELVDIVKETWDGIDWRILPQLHYLLWGGVKGV